MVVLAGFMLVVLAYGGEPPNNIVSLLSQRGRKILIDDYRNPKTKFRGLLGIMIWLFSVGIICIGVGMVLKLLAFIATLISQPV